MEGMYAFTRDANDGLLLMTIEP